MTTVKIKWDIGETVYLKTDPSQEEYLVTGFNIRPGAVHVQLSNCGEDITVYEFEISREIDKAKKMGLDSQDVEDD